LLDGRPRTAGASATAPSDLLIVTREQFLGLLAREPQLAEHLLRLLCARLRWVSALESVVAGASS
jgi:CRP/FNR family transcriptional regulator, cyclic AMP receptor protein